MSGAMNPDYGFLAFSIFYGKGNPASILIPASRVVKLAGIAIRKFRAQDSGGLPHSFGSCGFSISTDK
ncbi:unnamed protein product [Linum trigynum]|uniref:Uncharacterized protein n=1 Tax=Linum trigynum TaxID=586398 RepID=A0AAV2DQ31_9ROSI